MLKNTFAYMRRMVIGELQSEMMFFEVWTVFGQTTQFITQSAFELVRKSYLTTLRLMVDVYIKIHSKRFDFSPCTTVHVFIDVC